MNLASGHEMVHHLLVDMAWKAGIVVALVVLCVIAGAVIWAKVGR